MFIVASFTILKIPRQPKCPSTDECIKILWCVYIRWNITQPQKDEILPFAIIMDGLRGYQAK